MILFLYYMYMYIKIYIYIFYITCKAYDFFLKAMQVSIDITLTILLCDTCHYDTNSPSKRFCWEQKDHSFFSSQQSEFSSYPFQSLWVLHIANSLQQCSYVEQNRKARWFWLVKNEMLDL